MLSVDKLLYDIVGIGDMGIYYYIIQAGYIMLRPWSRDERHGEKWIVFFSAE